MQVELEQITAMNIYISKLEEALNDFVTEYCEREGDEDYPIPADEQEDELVKNAMKLLGI